MNLYALNKHTKTVDESEPFVIKIEADNSDVEMETTVTSSNMSKIQNDQPPAASVYKEDTLYLQINIMNQ
jgi:hypothetical protein